MSTEYAEMELQSIFKSFFYVHVERKYMYVQVLVIDLLFLVPVYKTFESIILSYRGLLK